MLLLGSSRWAFLSAKGKKCISNAGSRLASFLFALLASDSAFHVRGAIIPTRNDFAVRTSAGARDGTNYDQPPDQILSVITNGFWTFETNFTRTASVVSAQGQSGARQRVEVQPLLIAAEGEFNAAAATATNRDETASASTYSRVDLLFDLPVQHAYAITITNLGGVSAGSLLGQILLTRVFEEVFASRLPTNSGPSSQSGVLPRGSYRLLAEFSLNPAEAPPASSGSATFSLQMTFNPILPTLNIARSSNNVVLSWTTNDTAFFYHQSNSNLTTTNWTFIFGPYPVSVRQYTAVQSASDASQFYRLTIP